MKTKLILLWALCLVMCSCQNPQSGRTTNIYTTGLVLNQAEEPLAGIKILIQTEDLTINDSTITDLHGKFYRWKRDVPYPIPTVNVCANDPTGTYAPDTIQTRYMYECGTDAPPVEKDWAFNADELTFHLRPE